MLVSLIPFFLVARLAVDESTWKHGPEYVFDVEIKVTSTPMSHDGVQRSNYTFANLLCRPKALDILNCQLSNTKKQSTDITNENEIEVPEEQVKNEISEQPFEIKFDDRGIDYLIVDEEICSLKLNSLKSIVELLEIGADLNGVPDGTFEKAENSTIGYCNTTFTIKHSPWKGMTRNMKRQYYELESLPHLNKVSGETIEIEKMKNLDNCSCYATFYYGSYGENTVINNELPSHLMSFVSHIFVSDTRFVASATKKASLGSHENKDYFAIVEHTTLSLKEIRHAAGELALVPRASKSSIVANSDVKRIFSKK